MNLAVDLGNTRAKFYLFEGRRLRRSYAIVRYGREGDAEVKKKLSAILGKYDVQHCVLSSVVKTDGGIKSWLKKRVRLTELSARMPLPLRMRYKTPATLGKDRMALSVGGSILFPRRNVLIIGVGTCITYDFVNSKGEYLGGSISPGLQMRLKALHHYTGKLPLLKPHRTPALPGTTTKDSILTGVQQGIVNEMNGFYGLYMKKFGRVKAIITGGDAKRFAQELNFTTFAAPSLLAVGLNEILLHRLASQAGNR